MHFAGHPCRIGVPCCQIICIAPQALKIIPDGLRPYQIVRSQHLEGAGHLFCIQIALNFHHILEKGYFALGHKKFQLSCLSKSPSAANKIRLCRRLSLLRAMVTTQMLLELQGHEVQVTFDGLSGIEAAQKFKPEVIILDIGLCLRAFPAA